LNSAQVEYLFDLVAAGKKTGGSSHGIWKADSWVDAASRLTIQGGDTSPEDSRVETGSIDDASRRGSVQVPQRLEHN
jgi:hypothetical protein